MPSRPAAALCGSQSARPSEGGRRNGVKAAGWLGGRLRERKCELTAVKAPPMVTVLAGAMVPERRGVRLRVRLWVIWPVHITDNPAAFVEFAAALTTHPANMLMSPPLRPHSQANKVAQWMWSATASAPPACWVPPPRRPIPAHRAL